MLTVRTVVAYHWSSTVVTESVTTPASPVKRLIKQTITNNNKNQQQQTIKNRDFGCCCQLEKYDDLGCLNGLYPMSMW